MALTATVTPGKTFVAAELVTNSKLNQLAAPTVSIAGTADTTQITNDSVTADKAAFGPWFLCTDSGTANVHALAASGHSISAYATGLIVRYKVNDGPNTGSTTADLTSLGARKIYKLGSIEVQAGDLRAAQMVELVYDTALDSGTGGWWLISPLANAPNWDRYAETASATPNQYTVTFSPTVTALTSGLRVLVKWNATNTSTAQLDPDGLGLKDIRKGADAALVAGDLVDNQISELVYDATANTAAGAWLLTSPVTLATRTTVPVRQCVLSCSGDGTTGLPNYMVASTTTTIGLQNCDTTNLVMAFAYGFDTAGAVDYVAVVNTNTSSVWTGLNGVSTTYYLYADRDISTGAITYNKTTTRPIYTNVPGTGNNTYIIPQSKMVNGSSTAIQRLFLGEAATSAGSVISTITPYMPRGQFVSSVDIDTTLTNSIKTDTHQLGLVPRTLRCVLVAQTSPSTHGYAIGDEIDANAGGGSGVNVQLAANATTLTNRAVWFLYPPNLNTAAPLNVLLIAADWKWRFYAGRGW